MRRHTFLAAVSGVALAAVTTGALAQDPARLDIGATVQGEIDRADAVVDEGPYDAYGFQARRGQRYEATLRSGAFDAYLELYAPGATEATATDDDGLGEGTDARLRFTARTDGLHVLRARPLGEGEGAYSLTLAERGPAPPAPRPHGIRVGQTLRGDLDDRDPETEEGLLYDAYLWRARAGDRVLISLDSDAFDPVARIGRMNGGAFEELAQNDDGPNAGLNARLSFSAPANGDYVIRATSLDGSGGGYSLTVEEGPEAAPAQPIEIGGSTAGNLGEGSGRNAAGAPADRYRFRGREGQRVRIDMASDDFDAFVELFDAHDASLATDDDGAGEGTNSRLTFTLPADGDYVIEARAFSEATGGYTLSIVEIAPDKPAETLAFGALLQGEIGSESSRDDEDRGFDAYTFSGRAGQRVRAVMRSGDFDTYLQVGKAGGEFSALASDDDGLGEGTDSRLNFTLPEDGGYVVRASPLGSDGKGLYSLELIDRGPQPQPGSVLVGATARGTLTESDATADDNSFYDAYRITLRKDEKLLITMVSNEVDSLVSIGQDKGDDGFQVLGSDDDGLSDTHAKLEWTATEDGTFEIRAGTFQQGQTGAYALTIEKQL